MLNVKSVAPARSMALKSNLVAGFSDVIGEPSKYAYTNEDIENRYEIEGGKNPNIFLSTWFDSAQFGMSSPDRILEVARKRKEVGKNFNALTLECSNALINYYCDDNLRFTPNNVHFYSEGGTQAFKGFSPYIGEDDEVLMTNEAYSGIRNGIPKKNFNLFLLGS